MYIQVTITCPTRSDAQGLAVALVEDRLAACAQVGGPINSVYWWEGEVDQAEEWTCVAKTTAKMYDRLEAKVHEVHTYENPEVIAVEITRGSKDYLTWIKEILN